MDITSTANPKLKHVVKLRTCSVREESGEMIVEGYRECRRALDHGYRPHAIFHCPEFYLKNENEPAVVEECRRAGAEVYTCSRACFAKIAYKERPDGPLMVGPHVSIALPISRFRPMRSSSSPKPSKNPATSARFCAAPMRPRWRR